MKKNKNKKNNTGLYFGLALVGIILFSALVSNLTSKESKEVKFNSISYSQYEELFESEGLSFVYVGSEGCTYCQMIKPILGELQEEENIKFNYLSTDTMSNSDFEAISSSHEIFAGKWGTPTLLAFYDGEVVGTVDGYREKPELQEFVSEARKYEEK